MGFTSGLGRHVGRRRRGVRDIQLESDAAGVAFRAGILGSSQGSHLPPPPEAVADPDWVDPGLVEHTMPATKPHPRAQWDDAEGRWIIWNKDAGTWDPIG